MQMENHEDGLEGMMPRALRSTASLLLLMLSAMVVSPQRAAAQDPRATIRGEAAAASAPFRKELYFYLPFSNDALQNLFDPDIIVKNATTDFPVVEGMSGVAFAIQWSQLCPVENQCNFAIIDRVLDYWHAAGRKVILSVAPIFAPMEKFGPGGHSFVPGTPDWVLQRVATFQSESNNFIGFYSDWKDLANNPSVTFTFPRYDDARYVAELSKLIRELGARYDGHPAISYVRIAAGKGGEDNPIGRTGQMPGFSNYLWIDYTRKVMEAYVASFHKSRLEFDMLWTGIVESGAKNGTPITPAEQEEARRFLDEVVAKGVFVTFDGGPAPIKSVAGATAAHAEGVSCTGFSPAPDASTDAVTAAPFAVVEGWRQRGIPFGFEVAALSNPCDNPRLTRTILQRYRPSRVIFFADWAALINYHRNGLNPQNQWEVDAATSWFVPWTNAAELPAHRLQAKPQIDRFAAELDQLVRQIQQPDRDAKPASH
jgi:hypothetical protein